jgi:hypothetical protein
VALDEPERPTVDTVTATAKAATVTRRRATGDSQPLVCSHARAPLAEAIAVIAHPAHMQARISFAWALRRHPGDIQAALRPWRTCCTEMSSFGLDPIGALCAVTVVLLYRQRRRR